MERRINNRAAVLGYYKDGVYVSAYALNGAANTATGFDANNIYEFGTNGGYKYTSPSGNSKAISVLVLLTISRKRKVTN